MAVFTKNNKNRPTVGALFVGRRQIQILFSTVPVVGLESGCPRNVGSWPRIFFCVLGTGFLVSPHAMNLNFF